MSQEKGTLSLEEMAKELGIDEKTLKNRVAAGKDHPPYVKPARGVYQFPKQAYEKWMMARLVYPVRS